jgi:aryl-alcohol dehydrogenase-like predicted oxidoreductase
MIETMEFGGTKHRSSRVIFGAAALGSARPEAADRILQQVRDAGINHLDTAASYGESELRLAPYLQDHRADVFLATKTGERNGDKARAELERSLVRMGVDSVDLIQLHNLVEDDEWETAHGKGGVVEAMAQARSEGLVRHIGVTGHGLRIPRMHLRSLAEYPYSSVLFPYNYPLLLNATYKEDVTALINECKQKNVAMQTIKSVARRRWTETSSPQFSWYEPLADADAIQRAVQFVLSQPKLFLNSSSDTRTLPAIVRAASSPTYNVAPTSDQMEADIATHEMTALFDGMELERI